ncbi:MAG: PAS domain S-box protein [bacterium]
MVDEVPAVDPSLAVLAARWLSIAETARDGLLTIDAQGRITSINEAAERIFGWKSADVIGRNVSVLMPDPYRTDHDAYLARYKETGERRAIGRIRHVHAQRRDGELRPIELSISEGEVDGESFFTAIVRDVLDTDHRYRLVVDLAASVILLLSPELRVVEFNRESERVFGRTRADVLERSFLELVPPSERATTEAAFLAVLRGEELRGFEGLAQSGELAAPCLRWNASRIIDVGGAVGGIIAVAEDVTARRRAEDRLREEQAKLVQAEKLSSIGQLAAGVAHEVNNPLAGVKSLFAALRSGRVSEERLSTYYEAIQDGLTRIEQTVRALLDYARPSSGAVLSLDVHDIVSACLRLCRPALNKKRLEVDVRPEAGTFMIAGDRHGLMQATMNVLLNAVYAAPEGSTIVIDAEHTGDQVAVHFDDQGPGIPADKVARVCDPFYTTKPEGEGTGLGLAVTQSIIARHQGRLVVGSHAGGGARITFLLPVEEE